MDFLKRFSYGQMGWREIVVGLLIFSNILVWSLVYYKQPGDKLTVYFLDIGQGDAILIDSPNHSRMLIDGGRNRKVLTELGKILPFSDKRIDVVLATHPDADHIGGLPEVVDRYKIGIFLESGVESDNAVDNELKSKIEEKNIPDLLARRGMVVNFGDGVKLQILFPLSGQNVSNWETNRASIVARLVYRDQVFMFTGDSPTEIENVLVNLGPDLLDSDVLKVGHHGSATASADEFLRAVRPQIAVVSVGKHNKYHLPARSTMTAAATG